MPSQQEVRWSQLKIGVIVLVSAVILTTLLFLMTGAAGMGVFSHKLTIYTYFANSSDLKVGAPVNLEGVTIGSVKSIAVTTAPDRKLTPVIVVMKIDSKWQPGLHTDSTASLSTVGILGDTTVDINSRLATGPMLPDGAELKTKETRSIQEIEDEGEATLDQFNIMISKANAMISDLQAGKGTAGQFLENPDLYNKFDAAASNFNTLSEKLNRDDNTAGKFFNDHAQMYDKINDIIARGDDIANDLQNGKGTAGKFLKDPSVYNNANALLADAQAGKGTVGKLLKDDSLYNNTDASVASLKALLADAQAGKGSAGKFLKDDSIYNDSDKLVTETTNLIGAIRQNPKKYLTIQLKIF